MSHPTPVAAPPPTNTLGVAGFVLALVGLVGFCVPFAALLAPVGLVLSIIGLRQEPRGLAIAGVVLGAIGSLWMLVAIVLLGLFTGAAIFVGPPSMDEIRASRAESEVEALHRQVDIWRATHGLPQLPADFELRALADDHQSGILPENLVDPWGNPYLVEVDGEDHAVVSLGADGRPGGTDEDADVRHP